MLFWFQIPTDSIWYFKPFSQGKGDGLRVERSGLHDNWDDAEGYYSKRLINLY